MRVCGQAAILFLVAAVFLPVRAMRAEASAPFTTLVFGDGYLAQSTNSPPGSQRPYFTQSSRDNEPRINLLAAGGAYDDGLFRAKLIGQFGDSVDSNYSAEPEESFKYVQESYVGLRFSEETTLDAGTFLSHIGSENWLSSKNINYTRSMVAEFSPYYETGLRLSHTLSDELSAQLLVLNGWQNTTDERHPALGAQLSYTKDGVGLSSNTFAGEENGEVRLFHNLNASIANEAGTSGILSVDLGHQNTEAGRGIWWGTSAVVKQEVSSVIAINARAEYYNDPDSIIVTTPNAKGFAVTSVSSGVDITLLKGTLLRGELKRLWAESDVFLDSNSSTTTDTIAVMSLSFLDE
jgi:hypothetical protein